LDQVEAGDRLTTIVSVGNIMGAMKLGAVIKKLRAGRGWTQEELAQRSKLSRDYLAALETGHKDNPSTAVLKRLARALGVSVADLVE
jgi:transcriptional regulator with XRE-family HTH domain